VARPEPVEPLRSILSTRVASASSVVGRPEMPASRERLVPAEELDAAVLDALLHTYKRSRCSVPTPTTRRPRLPRRGSLIGHRVSEQPVDSRPSYM